MFTTFSLAVILDCTVRIVLGTALGALIGLERQLRARSAGIRTNALVALGSTLFVLVSEMAVAGGSSGDPTRVAAQVASGIGLQVFMTGRGTPYGLDVAPVIKVCSRNEMKEQWFDLIDISAGHVATGEATIAEVGTEIFNLILDVASGTKEPYSDQYGFHNDMCIFNPAPIT